MTPYKELFIFFSAIVLLTLTGNLILWLVNQPSDVAIYAAIGTFLFLPLTILKGLAVLYDYLCKRSQPKPPSSCSSSCCSSAPDAPASAPDTSGSK